MTVIKFDRIQEIVIVSDKNIKYTCELHIEKGVNLYLFCPILKTTVKDYDFVRVYYEMLDIINEYEKENFL